MMREWTRDTLQRGPDQTAYVLAAAFLAVIPATCLATIVVCCVKNGWL